MNPQTVTITLPSPIYRCVKQHSQFMHRSIVEELVAVVTDYSLQYALADDIEQELAQLDLFTEHELRQAAQTQVFSEATDEMQTLVEKQAEVVQLRQQQVNKSSRLVAEQDKRRKILGQLQTDLQSRTTELTTLEQDQLRLQKLVQSLTLALQDFPQGDGQYTSLRQLKGKLRWPVAGRITQPFGVKDAHGTLRTRGVLIATRAGSDVHAIASGRIAFSDWLRGFGLLLIIDHGKGYMSLYGQNRSLYKEVGEWVERGETVAAAGDSRGQTNAGLYLELRKDGKPFNPGRWFSGKPVPLQAAR